MTASAYKAIGILDSGVGGLTVFQEIIRQLPHEKIIYFGDTARMPYGPRPDEEVRRFALQIIDFFAEPGGQDGRRGLQHGHGGGAFPLPGPLRHSRRGRDRTGVRAALTYTRSGRIGVIGTAGTIRSSAYQKALQEARPDVHIIAKACPLFVLLVENDLVHTPEAEQVAEVYLAPFREAAVDTLILGCTHYPLMSDLIQSTVGPQVQLVNSFYQRVNIGNSSSHTEYGLTLPNLLYQFHYSIEDGIRYVH